MAVDSEATSGMARPEGVRARDDEHGDDPLEHERRVARLQDQPDDQSDDGGRERDVEEQRGGTVGEQLRAALARLRVGDEPHDAGQGGVVADLRDLDGQRAAGR